MNEIVNKFFSAEDKFMAEMHLNNLELLIVLVNHLLKIIKEFNKLKKLGMQDIFRKILQT